MSTSKSLFAQITKVDVAARTVTGIAMQEIVDRTNEKCLYDESKPYFQAWSNVQEKASGGKSKGNVREMHTSSAVGIVTELICDDSLKAFIITSEVVDDTAWKKVEKGVYTGFSIGANFAEKPKMVDNVLHWIADPVEVSLVDVPCVQTALFELKMADGSSHMHKFATVQKTTPEPEKKKSMYDVQYMASALGDLMSTVQSLEWEAQYENDDSAIPARIREWLKAGATIFVDLAEEETSEFAAAITASKAAKAARTKLAPKEKQTMAENEKGGALTAEQIKAFTDATESMKGAVATIETLKGVPDAIKSIETRLAASEETNAAFTDFVKQLGEEPAQGKTVHASAAAVTREQDKGTATGETKKELPKDSTNDKEARTDAYKSIYADAR